MSKLTQIFLIASIIILNTFSMSKVFKPSWQNEGVGAKVIRVIGNQHLRRLDPFLMLDYFKVRLPAGFPDHPHRGFQTITYMLGGKFHHQDFKGHRGTIGPGDIQWMTAGKGIVHSEIPASFQQDSLGFQLWLNLKSTEKMKQPTYQQFTNEQIPVYEEPDKRVKIICGKWSQHEGPVKYNTPSLYMDVQLKQNGSFDLPIDAGWNSIIFVYEGDLVYSAEKNTHVVQSLNCCVLETSQTKTINHSVKSKNGAKFLVIAGKPLKEPVASHGPFVMNTQQQIYETIKDYQSGKNGFENAVKWQSKIKDLRNGKTFNDL